MRTTIFLISFVVISAFAKQPLWSKTLIQSVDGKTFAEICKNSDYCKDADSKKLTDDSRFKITFRDQTTLLLSYKNSMVPISYKAGSTEYKINQKTLNIKTLASTKEIRQEIMKRLPNGTQAFIQSFLIEQAFAAGPYPSYELGTALTKLMVENQEEKICAQADEVVKKCDALGKELAVLLAPAMPQMKETDNVATTLKLKKDLLVTLKIVNGQLTHYSSLFTIAVKHKEALNKCGKLEAVSKCQSDIEKSKVAFQKDKKPDEIEKELELIDMALDMFGDDPVSPIKSKINLQEEAKANR